MLYLHQTDDIKAMSMLVLAEDGVTFTDSTFESQANDLWEYHLDYKRWWQTLNSKEFKYYLRVKKVLREFTSHEFYPALGMTSFDYTPLSAKPTPDASNFGVLRLPWPDELWFTSEGTLGDYLFSHPLADAAELNSFFGYSGPMDRSIVLSFFTPSDPAHPSVSDINGVIKGAVTYIDWPLVQTGTDTGDNLIANQPQLLREWWIPQPFPHIGSGNSRFSTTFVDTEESVTDGFLDRADFERVVPNWKSLVDSRVLMEVDPLSVEPPWNSGTTYAEDDTASLSGINYKSRQDFNSGHSPDVPNSVWWEVVPDAYYKHKKVKVISAMLYAPFAILNLFKAATKLRAVFLLGPSFGSTKDYRISDFPSLPANQGFGYPMRYLSGENFNSPAPPNPAPTATSNDHVPVGGSGGFLELIGGKEFAFITGTRAKFFVASPVTSHPIWVDGDARQQVVRRIVDSSLPRLTWVVSLGSPVLKFHDVGEIFYIAP